VIDATAATSASQLQLARGVGAALQPRALAVGSGTVAGGAGPGLWACGGGAEGDEGGGAGGWGGVAGRGGGRAQRRAVLHAPCAQVPSASHGPCTSGWGPMRATNVSPTQKRVSTQLASSPSWLTHSASVSHVGLGRQPGLQSLWPEPSGEVPGAHERGAHDGGRQLGPIASARAEVVTSIDNSITPATLMSARYRTAPVTVGSRDLR
jgi:hypothetical protein